MRGERGYTLVEMLVTLVIMSVVMTALTTLFVNASNAEQDMNNRFQAQLTGRLALDKMRREVHCASVATPPGQSSSVTLTLPAYCKTGSGSVTWCTRSVSTNRYALYRVIGATAAVASSGPITSRRARRRPRAAERSASSTTRLSRPRRWPC